MTTLNLGPPQFLFRPNDLTKVRQSRIKVRARSQHLKGDKRVLLRGEKANMIFRRHGIPRQTRGAIDMLDRELLRTILEITTKACKSAEHREKRTIAICDMDAAARSLGFDPCYHPTRHTLRLRKQRRRELNRLKASSSNGDNVESSSVSDNDDDVDDDNSQ